MVQRLNAGEMESLSLLQRLWPCTWHVYGINKRPDNGSALPAVKKPDTETYCGGVMIAPGKPSTSVVNSISGFPGIGETNLFLS
jgi:hypothetical protein